MLLSGAGLVLVLVATVLITLLVSGRADSGPAAKPTTAGHEPSITLNGPEVARYIVDSYAVRGVTCPTVSVPVDGSFLCSDPNGATYTIQIVKHGQAYTVHPN
jgi:hypothetical protein